VIFFGVGGYYIYTKDDENALLSTDDGSLVLDKYKATIVTCVLASVVVSLIYILLVKVMPKVMVLVMTFFSLGLIAVLCAIGIVTQNYGLAIPFGVMLLVYVCILFCFRDKIKTGIVLVRVATNFISAKPIIFITPIIKVVLTTLFAVFWIYTVSLISQRADLQDKLNKDSTPSKILIGVWVLLWLFYTFFFYYIMVFTIAVTCAFWYYNVQGKNPIITAYKWIFRSALGAITYAALIISIVTFARLIIDSKRQNNKNLAVTVCLCILSCLMRQI